MSVDRKSINLTLTKPTGVRNGREGAGLAITQKQSPLRRRLAPATMLDRCLPGLRSARPRRTLPASDENDGAEAVK